MSPNDQITTDASRLGEPQQDGAEVQDTNKILLNLRALQVTYSKLSHDRSENLGPDANLSMQKWLGSSKS